jgi:hypothetical protein
MKDEPFELPLQIYMVDGFRFKFRSEEAARAFRRGLANKRQNARLWATVGELEWEEVK